MASVQYDSVSFRQYKHKSSHDVDKKAFNSLSAELLSRAILGAIPSN